MITDVEILDYQAIREGHLKLGWFTVITGPSNSGKSAVIRAIRLAAFNARGTDYIRRGAKVAKVALGLQDEGYAVGIDRGSRGADAYRLVHPADQPDDPPQVETYTKLAGVVPAEVSEILRLSDVNFAGQLDPTFMLMESGGQVARVLGKLTNVTIVFEAAREAVRRKLETSRDLRAAEADLADLKAQAQQFRGLKERRAAAAEAREALVRLNAAQAALLRLSQHAAAVGTARQGLQAAEQQLTARQVPSAELLESLALERARIRILFGTISGEQAAALFATEKLRDAQRAEVQAENELHELLVAAGRCPTCGSVIT